MHKGASTSAVFCQYAHHWSMVRLGWSPVGWDWNRLATISNLALLTEHFPLIRSAKALSAESYYTNLMRPFTKSMMTLKYDITISTRSILSPSSGGPFYLKYGSNQVHRPATLSKCPEKLASNRDLAYAWNLTFSSMSTTEEGTLNKPSKEKECALDWPQADSMLTDTHHPWIFHVSCDALAKDNEFYVNKYCYQRRTLMFSLRKSISSFAELFDKTLTGKSLP